MVNSYEYLNKAIEVIGLASLAAPLNKSMSALAGDSRESAVFLQFQSKGGILILHGS
jgi:hypothetical protein